MTLGTRLKKLRIEKNLQQGELADILKVHKGSISNWETDRRFPDKEILYSLCEFFQVSSDYLLGFSNTRNRDCIPDAIDIDIFEELGKLLGKDHSKLSHEDKENLLQILKLAWPKNNI